MRTQRYHQNTFSVRKELHRPGIRFFSYSTAYISNMYEIIPKVKKNPKKYPVRLIFN